MLGYQVFLASTGIEGLELVGKEQPDLIILDIMLPQLDGYKVCKKIREECQTPIIMLTALGDIKDRIRGLDLGADDYVIKPFSPKELEARIRSVLRRSKYLDSPRPQTIQNILTIGQLKVDRSKRQILKGSSNIKLTDTEFSLLDLLISNAGKNLSRATILCKIWGYAPKKYVETRVVDVHISRLRSKLEDNPSEPTLILTARGTGYMFKKTFL